MLAPGFYQPQIRFTPCDPPDHEFEVVQLSSEPNETNREDDMNYSHALVRRLNAEQLLDCQHEVAGVTRRSLVTSGWRATQLPGLNFEKRREKSTMNDQFLGFRKPPRLLTCECERSIERRWGRRST
jgi:hypothetical protein